MLIEFSVSNFRSFRGRQTFSMVAAPRLKKKGNVFHPSVDGEKLPSLLRVAAIYGPNASGKSNLIRAMGAIVKLVSRKPTDIDEPLSAFPFRFDTELAEKPSCFELHFIVNKQRYQFEVDITSERIVRELLYSFPRGKETLLYERKYDSAGEKYNMGDLLEGGQELHKLWQNSTSPRMLFISQAVANSSEELSQLRLPFSWLHGGMEAMIHGELLDTWTNVLQKMGSKYPELSEDLSDFLEDIDIPVSHIQFEDNVGQRNLSDLSQASVNRNKMRIKTTLTHKTAIGEAKFDFEEESEGTKGLMAFWLPWMILNNGRNNLSVLAIDELDSSLHPEIVASVVRAHLNTDAESQLIFTTHDTHLMDAKLLRRDQFWLCERDQAGATNLRSVHDFDGREGEDIEKRYYEGRYRGLPILRNM